MLLIDHINTSYHVTQPYINWGVVVLVITTNTVTPTVAFPTLFLYIQLLEWPC
jgi:hypothetical protein